MRKVTKEIKDAWQNNRSKKVCNTHTDGVSVWLHNNKIIERRSDGVYWTLAGWPTRTTMERINGIIGVGVYCKKYTPMIKGEKVNINEWMLA